MPETAAAKSVVPSSSPGTTALDLFRDRVAQSGERIAFRRKIDGSWRPSTFAEWDRAAREIAAGLRSLGIDNGDRVVILADTRQEWAELDVGILMAGAVTVPIYPSSTSEQCAYIIANCAARVVVCEDPHQLQKLADPDIAAQITQVEHLVYVSSTTELDKPDDAGRKRIELADIELPPAKDGKAEDWTLSLEDLRARGTAWLQEQAGELDAIISGVTADQAATFVYTSGTTGPPKGVVLTHSNIAFECVALTQILDIGEDDEQLLFLPLAHIFAKILMWCSVATGATMAFAEGVPQLIANMGEVKPTFMGAVPRVYEKAYAKIQSNFEAKKKSALGRLIIDFALKHGKRRSEIEQKGGRATGLGIALADKLVFSKVRAIFGGRLRFFISGGAPLSGDIASFFHAAGILVLEGYGLTETTAAANINVPNNFRFGTVGPAVPGVDIKIAEDGEILMRGGTIMQGYYNLPEATAEAIDQDGWFHSGDIGVIEDGGHLRITDRKKDIIVTAGGKNVAPQNIENAFKAKCPLASQMMVYGDKRKYLAALVTLSEEALVLWAKEQGISYSDYAELTQTDAVKQAVQTHIDQLNAALPSYETIKKFRILPRDFDQESGELTPTLKVKRKFCSEKYRGILEGFNGDATSSL